MYFDESSWTLEIMSNFLGGNPSLVMFPSPFTSFIFLFFIFLLALSLFLNKFSYLILIFLF